MKILFLTYHGFEEASGISKKMLAQIKGLRENGHKVAVCHYSYAADGSLCRYVGTLNGHGGDTEPLNGHGSDADQVIANYGHGKIAALRQRMSYGCIYDYCVDNGIELVYARSFMNASPPLVQLFRRLRKAGVKLVMEIPTYPYDGEFASLPLKHKIGHFIDKLFRRQLAAQFDGIVTFSGATSIFGQRTINISNGVDMDAIPLKSEKEIAKSEKTTTASGSFTSSVSEPNYGNYKQDELHLIGVAEVHPWHGFDRVIKGLGEYYSNVATAHPNRHLPKVFFHIVGNVAEAEMQGTRMAPGFHPIIEQYGIGQYVVFHGQLFGHQLDEVFNRCQFAIGSLGRHRSGITHIKTLKNREYACRGIPFIYSECDADFDGQPYVLKAPADESPIAIAQIVDFVNHCKLQPADIRKTVEHLTWKRQMQLVIEKLEPCQRR